MIPSESVVVDENNLISSSTSSLNDEIIIVEESSANPNSIATILNLCKKKLLKPYLKFLSLIGLKPLWDLSFFSRFLNYLHNIQIIIFLIIGYILQYSTNFRRDRGFMDKTSENNKFLIINFILPSILHFTGYIYSIIIFRKNDDNQLLVLIERVFLISINRSENEQHKIVQILWIFFIIAFVWTIFSISLIIFMITTELHIEFIIFNEYINQNLLKILLIFFIIWQDIVQSIIVTNYCIQVEFLKKYAEILREKLLQQSVTPIEWIREIEEFRKLLNYLNHQISPAICIFTILNSSYAISSILFWLIMKIHNNNEEFIIMFNILLWWCITVIPFVQAARLTSFCNNLKSVGLEVRTRPFVHQNTPLQELNSILLYTMNLKIYAKLFHLKINGKFIVVVLVLFLIIYFVIINSNYDDDDDH